MILYDLERSGNCYKVRLLLAFLGMTYQKIPFQLHAEAPSRTQFQILSPRGQVPVLVDQGLALWDSTAILVYLARRYGGEVWLPIDPEPLGQLMQWLALEQNEGRYGLARSRAIKLNNPTVFAQTGSLHDSQALGKIALDVLNSQLCQSAWLVPGLAHPTIAEMSKIESDTIIADTIIACISGSPCRYAPRDDDL